MGGMQATSLLARHGCDILIHLNTRTSTDIPSHGRISGFLDLCEEKHLNHRVIYRDIGTEYEVMKKNMGEILDEIDQLILNRMRDSYISLNEKLQLRQELFYSVRKLDVTSGTDRG